MAHFATPFHKPRGNTLVMAMILVAVVLVLVVLLFDTSEQNLRTTAQRINTQSATRLAEAGVEKAIWCLNTGSCPGGSGYTGESNTALGEGTFTTIVTCCSSTRTVTATGSVNSLNGPSTQQVTVKLTMTTTNVAFQYGVQTGVGGVKLENNAHINGNLFSSGSVEGDNNSYITDDVILTVSNPLTDVTSSPSVSPLQLKNFGEAGSTTYVVQSFRPATTDRLYSVDLKIAKHNAPTSNVTLYVYDDNAGAPGANLSGSGQALTVSVPNDSPAGWENGWTNQIYAPTTTLVAGNTYWLVLKVSATNSTKYWVLPRGVDTAYADGTAKSGSALTSMSPACTGGCDLAFRINVGGVPPTLKIPRVDGNGYARTIESTTLGKKAYYQNLIGSVKANAGAETCTTSSNGPFCFGSSADQTPVNFPISDAEIAQMEGQAANGGTTNCPTGCTLTSGTIGPKKYVGNVTIEGNVTLDGTVWVVGNLTVTNNAIVSLSAGYGNTSGVIVADDPDARESKGLIVFSNNGNLRGNANPGTYIMTVSMNADAAFTATAIDVSNNLTAGVLYAPYGKIHISNNAQLKEVTAQRLHLDNNASVQYETGLANVIFSSGPGGAWTYDKGTYKIN